ncbi:hypothetical protein L5G32_09125 [Gordonia sp. HY002]|uniref:hypothetical protein n=1 Tax=Gordonia zhenghanii TaxID=2911516 RepID=UPI001EF053E1|nr:hypothetical protein [Gordonia zhenghanii]MCF8570426.1 hypothetical protein [Gordonia zhenghanii]MCF8607507.1 hypothetical protein [Gordonia zhenghanii]
MSAAGRIARTADAAADALDDAERRYLLRQHTRTTNPCAIATNDDTVIAPLLGPAIGRRARR